MSLCIIERSKQFDYVQYVDSLQSCTSQIQYYLLIVRIGRNVNFLQFLEICRNCYFRPLQCYSDSFTLSIFCVKQYHRYSLDYLWMVLTCHTHYICYKLSVQEHGIRSCNIIKWKRIKTQENRGDSYEIRKWKKMFYSQIDPSRVINLK